MLSNLKIWSYISKDSIETEESNSEINSAVVESETPAISSVSKVTDKANEWKDYLLGASKTASSIAVKQVSSTAKNLRQNVSDLHIMERSNMFTDFSSEQIKFKSEKSSIEKKTNEVCLPWIDALNFSEADEQNLKSKILSVSTDELNFTRNPPSGSDFEFNCGLYSPVAILLLKEDTKLAEMRFKLVPKKIKEEIFWRNYFYRISLIKQSLQGGSGGNIDHQDSAASDGIDRTGPAKSMANQEIADKIDYSGNSNQRKIDCKPSIGNDGDECKDDPVIKSGSLPVAAVAVDNSDDWEAELQKELSEFELVNDENNGGGMKDLNDLEERVDFDDLEKEIMNELEK